MMNPKAESNFTQINRALQGHLKGNMNSCRIKLIAQLVMALCKVQTVTFSRLATGFETNGQATTESSLRRIQRFIANYALDLDLMARLIMKLVPAEGPHKLAIDRTDWEFGKHKINILALGIVYDGCAFPILFTMLPKKGNSHTEERKALIDRFIRLFGEGSVESLLADREFVGHNWVSYLAERKVSYFIRIRENFLVHFPNGDKVLARRLFRTLKVGEKAHREQPVTVNGITCYLTACRIKAPDGRTALQLIISYRQNECPIQAYKNRWQIETMFKALKTSGFNIEETHLDRDERMARLLMVVMLAYTWAYRAGIYLHEKVKEIKVKKHGRRAKSLVKYGLEFLAETLLNPFNEPIINVFRFLSCT